MKDGHGRERQVAGLLEDAGWVATRAAGSLGDYDLHASKAGESTRLIEVKGNEGSPFKDFGPDKRRALLEAADRAGAEAFLVHWPSRCAPHWLRPAAWPQMMT